MSGRVIRHRSIDIDDIYTDTYWYVKLNWDANCFFPAESRLLIPLCMSTEICRLGEGHNWCPLECRLSVGKPFPRRPRNCYRLETLEFWLCHLQCTCFSNQFLDEIGSFATWNQKFVSAISIFVNERVPDDCCKHALQFLVRNCSVKGRKIEGLDVSDKVEILRFKMFRSINSFELFRINIWLFQCLESAVSQYF